MRAVSKDEPRILMAGGGTGGHLFPALAIADEIRKMQPKAHLLFVGTKGKIEAHVVPERGYEFRTIWISGFHRRVQAGNLLVPLKVIVSLTQSFFLIRQFKPDVVVGTGGYVCGPVLYVASLLGVPTVVHESNSYPGVTTRMVAHHATKVFTAFEATNGWLRRRDNVERVGTPTRESLNTVSREEAAKRFKIDPTKKTLLVFGGSLGAASINDAVLAMAKQIVESGVQLIWQTGAAEYERIAKMVTVMSVHWLGAFIDRMEEAYAVADLVVCRAGATTIAELTRLGKAAVLIPFPAAAADHQTLNARTLADAGAAILIPDHDAGDRLRETIRRLLDDDHERRRMESACRMLGRPDAGHVIAEKVLAMIPSSIEHRHS